MNTIAEALADVEHAFRHLEFAIKLMCYCEGGRLDLEAFDADTTILLVTENVGFPTNHFSSIEAVIPASQALVGMAFGTSAMVLEAAFEVAGLSRNPSSRLPADELRTLVFMVRCAFCSQSGAAPLGSKRSRACTRHLRRAAGLTVFNRSEFLEWAALRLRAHRWLRELAKDQNRVCGASAMTASRLRQTLTTAISPIGSHMPKHTNNKMPQDGKQQSLAIRRIFT